ncbi:acyltransferase family protein [Actinacidiphila soli]|uniref:acyltransferase family protein n=1 Tax=Actinacidiphila soli TaxID=2487275 RepID=UPI000FCB9760|nr:acyltransferase family protein [Actinacidiphila soli]
MSTEYRRVRGLDGLRALAVAAVVVYHVHAPWLRGGFLGVDLFFVISGYLITSLLAADHWRSGRIRLGAFWKRRALRLLPLLWLVLAVTACAATLTGGDAWDGLRGAVAAALTYRSNWWQLAQHDMYFAQFGAVPVLQHLWSLSVEEQFYLGWPLLLWVVMGLLRRQRAQAACAAMLALASFTAMALLYEPGSEPSRVYYGTDTHGGGLLLGAAVALVLPLTRAGTLRRPEYVRAIDALGAAGLAGLALTAVLADGNGAFLYRGGLVGVCLAAAALTVAACTPGTVARALGWAPLVWLGRRSYGVYLWHWPVLACLTNAADGVADSASGRLVSLVVPVGLAAVSYRALEEPLLRLGVRAWAERVSGRVRAAGARRPRLVLGAAMTGLAVLGTAYVGVSRAPSGGGLEAQIAAGRRAIAVRPTPPAPSSGSSPAAPASSAAPQRVASLSGGDVTAVGDSVMLASAAALESRFPGIYVDAVVGRQMSSAPEQLARLAAAGRLRRVVVVGLGTNGDFTPRTLERILRIAGSGRAVVFVNVHVPRSWESRVNTALTRGVGRHQDVAVLADWSTAISRYPEGLWSDRIHPRPSGARLYADVVAAAVRDTDS